MHSWHLTVDLLIRKTIQLVCYRVPPNGRILLAPAVSRMSSSESACTDSNASASVEESQQHSAGDSCPDLVSMKQQMAELPFKIGRKIMDAVKDIAGELPSLVKAAVLGAGSAFGRDPHMV